MCCILTEMIVDPGVQGWCDLHLSSAPHVLIVRHPGRGAVHEVEGLADVLLLQALVVLPCTPCDILTHFGNNQASYIIKCTGCL